MMHYAGFSSYRLKRCGPCASHIPHNEGNEEWPNPSSSAEINSLTIYGFFRLD
jgi:hypothetical protein